MSQSDYFDEIVLLWCFVEQLVVIVKYVLLVCVFVAQVNSEFTVYLKFY